MCYTLLLSELVSIPDLLSTTCSSKPFLFFIVSAVLVVQLFLLNNCSVFSRTRVGDIDTYSENFHGNTFFLLKYGVFLETQPFFCV